MIETKTKNIGGKRYECTQFPAMIAMKLATRVSKMVGPGAAGLAHALLAGKDGLDGDIRDINLQGGVTALIERLDENESPALIAQLLSSLIRDGMRLDTEENINKAFTGNMLEMVQAIAFVIEANFPDLIQALEGTGNQKNGSDQPASASPENSTPT